MKHNCTFPETVEHKSCTATIYQQQHRGGERFEVRYYDVDGSKQRVTFPTYPSAKKFADSAVKELAEHREHFITLRGRDALEYQTAVETLAPLGLTISQAATRLIGDNPILRPVESKANKFLERRLRTSLRTAFIDAVAAVETQLLSQETLAARLCRSPDRCYLRSVKINVHLRLALK